jgi:general secretion pathway protein D
MKVQLQIGDRIPYATGSFQPGVGTVGVSPLVSTQFQFADTGVTVDLTPQVHNREEVTLHIEITVSAVKSYITIGGSGGLSQPVIGQRKSIADIRLREGEVNILSGLSETQDTHNVSGFPGLTNVPVLSNIFGTNHTEKDRQELMIALIPHIVRTPDYSPENLRGIYAGSDQVVKLSYAPRPEDVPPTTPPAAPAPSPAPAPVPAPVPGLAVPAPAPSPAPVKPDPTAAAPVPVPAPIPIPGLPPAPGAAPAAVPAGGAPRVRFLPAAVMVARDTPFTISVQLDNVPDATTGVAPLRVRWDASKLRLNDVAAGELLSRGGVTVAADKQIPAEAPGEATVTLTRAPGSTGVSGSGVVATLNFTATGSGTSAVSVTEAGLKNAQNQPVASAPGDVIVTVQ